MNAIVQHSPQQGLIPRNMPEAMQLAEMMARGKMMPDHLKNPGDALMVVEQAMRWNMSPFAVAQSTYNIKGKLLFSGTIVHAAIENSGAIVGLLNYEFSGEGMARKVTVSATRRGEIEPKTIAVVLKDAITDNPLWKKQPDQQLCYHGVRVWGRRWTPGVMLGVYTPEEWREQPKEPFDGTTIDAEPSRTLSTGGAISDEIPERVMEPKPKVRTRREVMDDIHATFAACHTPEEEDAILQTDDVVKALKTFTNGLRDELHAVLAEVHERVRAPDDGSDAAEPEKDEWMPGDP
jgi:hypothetical protein